MEITKKNLAGWTKKLSSDELKHLREEAGVHTTEQLRELMEYTKKEYLKGKRGLYCPVCLGIGKKLDVIE